jgi:transcriptional regulator with XRE-family HTH domain
MKTPESIALGTFLRHRRSQLGEYIRHVQDRCGLSKSYLAYIEAGERPNPSVQTVEKLAVGYKLDPTVLRRLALGSAAGDPLSRSAALESTLRRIESLHPSTQVEMWHLIDALVTHRERAHTDQPEPVLGP